MERRREEGVGVEAGVRAGVRDTSVEVRVEAGAGVEVGVEVGVWIVGSRERGVSVLIGWRGSWLRLWVPEGGVEQRKGG